MTRFAFYGRVSTEDQQDPVASKSWQRARATTLIEPHGGRIVAEFFDVGQSRSLPWKRRPEAARLLDALKDRGRGFDAVVVGEPHRAFSGNQFGLTFPIFIHYGVELWVPEVGGRIDPDSEAHDMMMSVFGGISKGERARTKVRVRSAMASQAATEGRFLGGRPPFGYQLADAGPHPNPGKAAAGQRMHRLEVDPLAAPVVQRIFDEWLSGRGLGLIAEGLTRDGIPSPSAHDPARNRHRASSRGAWGKSAVRAILANPRYTGKQVWNKQRRDEVLLDVDDVAAGYETRLRWNDPSEWIWSAQPAQEALIDMDTFTEAQRHLSAGKSRPSERRSRPTPRPYLLRGLIRCGVCERKMQGQPNHGNTYYRCRFPSEYALAERIDHPRTVYVREDQIVPELDGWLAQAFDPEHLDDTLQALAAADQPDDAAEARAEAARRKIMDCDRRLANYRKALDAGGDTALLVSWMAEVQGERLAAEAELGVSVPQEPMTKDQLRKIIASFTDHFRLLAEADPATKATLYEELGVRLTYQPERHTVIAEMDLARVHKSVSEGRLQPVVHALLGMASTWRPENRLGCLKSRGGHAILTSV